MDATHLSLLTQARSGSHAAWTRMVELYQPLIYGWLRRHGVSHHDAEELSQDSLLAVARELPRFSHSGNVGAFRLWVYRITANRARAFWRAGRVRATATGDSRFRDIVEQFEDPGSELSQAWEREHDRFLLLRPGRLPEWYSISAQLLPGSRRRHQRRPAPGTLVVRLCGDPADRQGAR